MPTGFTADLYDGKKVSFLEFAMKCASGVGYSVIPTDGLPDSMAADESRLNDHLSLIKSRAEVEIARIEAWDEEEADRLAQENFALQVRMREDVLSQRRAVRIRYEEALVEAKAWPSPTPKHDGLKTFMIQELEEAIAADCDTENVSVPKRLTGKEFKEQKLQALRRSLVFNEKMAADELRKVAERHSWVRELRNSMSELSNAKVEA